MIGDDLIIQIHPLQIGHQENQIIITLMKIMPRWYSNQIIQQKISVLGGMDLGHLKLKTAH